MPFVSCSKFNQSQATQDQAIADLEQELLNKQATQDQAIADLAQELLNKQNALNDCSGNPLAGTVPTCAQMTTAIQTAIDALPADKFLQGLQSYNPATNTMTLLMSDGSTVDVDMTDLVADAVSGGAAPSGAAGGDLVGTYPNPTVKPATTTQAGKVELATKGETVAGTRDDVAVTPAGVAAAIASIPLPTSLPPSGAAGGDLAGTYPNPTVVQATTTTAGKVELATNAEATTGTSTTLAVTPSGLKAAIDAIVDSDAQTLSVGASGLTISNGNTVDVISGDSGNLLQWRADGAYYGLQASPELADTYIDNKVGIDDESEGRGSETMPFRTADYAMRDDRLKDTGVAYNIHFKEGQIHSMDNGVLQKFVHNSTYRFFTYGPQTSAALSAAAAAALHANDPAIWCASAIPRARIRFINTKSSGPFVTSRHITFFDSASFYNFGVILESTDSDNNAPLYECSPIVINGGYIENLGCEIVSTSPNSEVICFVGGTGNFRSCYGSGVICASEPLNHKMDVIVYGLDSFGLFIPVSQQFNPALFVDNQYRNGNSLTVSKAVISSATLS